MQFTIDEKINIKAIFKSKNRLDEFYVALNQGCKFMLDFLNYLCGMRHYLLWTNRVPKSLIAHIQRQRYLKHRHYAKYYKKEEP